MQRLSETGYYFTIDISYFELTVIFFIGFWKSAQVINLFTTPQHRAELYAWL